MSGEQSADEGDRVGLEAALKIGMKTKTGGPAALSAAVVRTLAGDRIGPTTGEFAFDGLCRLGVLRYSTTKNLLEVVGYYRRTPSQKDDLTENPVWRRNPAGDVSIVSSGQNTTALFGREYVPMDAADCTAAAGHSRWTDDKAG